MTAHIGVDAASGLVHTVVGTSANVSDINVAGALLHDEEHAPFRDCGYQGVHKRAEAAGPTWHVAFRPGKRRLLNPFIEPEFVAERVKKVKASIRAKVEHPFRVIKQQFGFKKVRYRGLGEEHGADRQKPAASEYGGRRMSHPQYAGGAATPSKLASSLADHFAWALVNAV